MFIPPPRHTPLIAMPTLNDAQRERLRQRVEASVTRQRLVLQTVFFFLSLFLFILFTVITTQLPGPATDAVILPIVGWGTTLFLQLISLVVQTQKGSERMREQALTQELNALMMEEMLGVGTSPLSEKPKRTADESAAPRYTLSDDGEIVPADEAHPPSDLLDEDSSAARRARG